MGFFDWFRTATMDTAPIEVREIVERAVGPGDALGLSTVYRAVSIIAVAVKQLGIKVYREDAPVEAPSWIRRPDYKLSRSAFFEQTVYSLALSGNAYWLVTRDNQNRVTNLQVLNPLDVQIETNGWEPTGYSYQGKTYDLEEIKHLAVGRVPGHLKGQGPIQQCQAELRGALDTSEYAGTWFRDTGVPTGVLKTEQVLSPDQAQQYKNQWTETHGAKRGVAVIGQGLSYSPIYLNPRDAQFIESQNFNVTQVARMFGIPARLLLASVDGGSDTYANLEQDEIVFMRYTLSNYVVEVEEALSALLPGRQEAKFNIDALLRPDTLTRYQAHAIALQNGWLTVDEVRAIENLPPAGDKETDAGN